MSSTTSLVASKIRLQQWAMQIRECQNRPANMNIDDWCVQNNLTKANYYYRLRRVREACLQVTGKDSLPEFVELKEPVSNSALPSEDADNSTAATITIGSNIKIELLNNASAEFITNLLGAVQHAQ